MRLDLWPHCAAEDHAAEMRDYVAGDGPYAAFVAVAPDGWLGGFVEVSLRNDAEGCTSHPVGYIEGVFVQPDFRGRGVGRSLVRQAEQWAVSQGCLEMASDCAFDNPVSLTFHRQLGFDVAEKLIHFRRALTSDGQRLP